MRLRITYCGNFTQIRSTEGYVADALTALGVDVVRLQETEFGPGELIHRVKAEKPDVFMFSKCEIRGYRFKDPTTTKHLRNLLGDIRRRGVKVVSWVFDLMRPDFSPERYEWAKDVASQCHLFLTTDTYGEGFENHRCLRQGYAGPLSAGLSVKKIQTHYEVAHLGELYSARRAWARQIEARLGNRFGVVRGVFEEKLHALLGSVRLILGPPWPFYPGYWSNRIYLVGGYGGCLLAPIVPGMEEEGWRHMDNMVGCPKSAECQAEMAFDLLKQPEELERIGENAARFVWENHTYNHRAKVLLGWLKELQGG